MEVILKRNFNKLGYKNDIVRVKNGYGLNYLIPRGIAVFATKSAKKEAQENIKQGLKKQEKLRNEALEICKKIEGMTISLDVNLGKDGKVFPVVSAAQIVSKLKEQFEFDFYKDSIIFNKKIDTIGKHIVEIKIFRDVVAKVNVELKKTEGERKKQSSSR